MRRVFVSSGKVYTLANQDFKDLAANAGKTVRLAGDMRESAITITKISAPVKKAAAKKS